MNEEKTGETNFIKQTYEIIKKYSKHLTTTNTKLFSQEILTTIFNNFNLKSSQNEFFISIYSFIIHYEILNLTNKGYSSNIFKAIQNNDLESVKYLIENCLYSIYDINEEGKSVLSYCFESHNKNIYDYLLSKVRETDFIPIKEKPKDFEPDIFKACKEGKLKSVQWLIEKEKINKNQKDEKGNTPIHIACTRGHLPIVQYLIEKQK